MSRATWMTVICREDVTEALPWTTEEDARAYFDRAKQQWSECFLTRIEIGPRDVRGFRGGDRTRQSIADLESTLGMLADRARIVMGLEVPMIEAWGRMHTALEFIDAALRDMLLQGRDTLPSVAAGGCVVVSRTYPPVNCTDMNPGIIRLVNLLRAWGFDTRDSGDGQTHKYDCDFPGPFVTSLVDPNRLVEEARRLSCALRAIGIECMPLDPERSAPYIECHFSPCDEFALISLYEVTDEMLGEGPSGA